jgi:hypothetical protein
MPLPLARFAGEGERGEDRYCFGLIAVMVIKRSGFS